jgi:hypothetical protein
VRRREGGICVRIFAIGFHDLFIILMNCVIISCMSFLFLNSMLNLVEQPTTSDFALFP